MWERERGDKMANKKIARGFMDIDLGGIIYYKHSVKTKMGDINIWKEILARGINESNCYCLLPGKMGAQEGCWFSCHSRARTAKSVSLSASMITFLRPASHFLPIWCINNVYRVKMWDLNQESENYFPAPLHSNNDVTDISFSKTHPA